MALVRSAARLNAQENRRQPTVSRTSRHADGREGSLVAVAAPTSRLLRLADRGVGAFHASALGSQARAHGRRKSFRLATAAASFGKRETNVSHWFRNPRIASMNNRRSVLRRARSLAAWEWRRIAQIDVADFAVVRSNLRFVPVGSSGDDGELGQTVLIGSDDTPITNSIGSAYTTF